MPEPSDTVAPVGSCKPEHYNRDVMAEDSNGRWEKSWNFYLKKKDETAAPSHGCGNPLQHPLLLGHLLLIVTSEIDIMLRKTGFVWIFINKWSEVSAIPAQALRNCHCYICTVQNRQTVLTLCSPSDGPLIPSRQRLPHHHILLFLVPAFIYILNHLTPNDPYMGRTT